MTKTAAAAGYAMPKINEIELKDLYLAAEAPKGVNLVVRDSGSGSPLTDEELKASIYTNGILVPLIYKNVDGKAYVIAGNRRLRMLRSIFANEPDATVPCHSVKDFGEVDWRQIAIDTNLSLPPHIVERYEQIVLLAKDLKLSPEDAQARFGLTTRQYNQVMALGKMSPTVRELWRTGEINAKTAQAFTLESDPKEQDRVYALVKKQAWRGEVSDHDIRSNLTPPNQQEVGKLVSFLGVENVRKAKLLKTEDLFASSHTVTDPKALKKMAEDQLKKECDRLVEIGWSWAIFHDSVKDWYQYGSIEPKDASKPTTEEAKEIERLQQAEDSDADETLERMIEAIKERGYTAEQRKKAGCFVSIDHNGRLSIEYGKVKPAERKSVKSSERSQKVAAKKKAKVKAGEVPLTNALAERLSQQLEKALAFSLVSTPDVAVAALIAAFASNGHILDVKIGGDGRDSYGKSGNSDKNFAQVFEGAVKATPESRVVMLCEIAARAFSIQIHNAAAKAPIDGDGLQALVAKLNSKMVTTALGNTFDAKDYFGSVNLTACVAAVRSACGDGAAAEVAKMKKAAAAKFAAEHVVKEGWLPRELRTVHYKGPTEKASAAARTAKPAKKAAAKKAAKKGKK